MAKFSLSRSAFVSTSQIYVWYCDLNLGTKNYTVVHEGIKSQNQSLYKAIICGFVLNLLFVISRHNILVIVIDMK